MLYKAKEGSVNINGTQMSLVEFGYGTRPLILLPGLVDGLRTVKGQAFNLLFFIVGVMKTLGSFAEMKRPEIAVKMFIRVVLAKAAVTYGLRWTKMKYILWTAIAENVKTWPVVIPPQSVWPLKKC